MTCVLPCLHASQSGSASRHAPFVASPAEIEAAEEAGQHSKAEQLRKARRAELIRKLRQMQRKNVQQGRGSKSAAAVSVSGKLSRAEVAEADVARIISSWTGQSLALHTTSSCSVAS